MENYDLLNVMLWCSWSTEYPVFVCIIVGLIPFYIHLYVYIWPWYSAPLNISTVGEAFSSCAWVTVRVRRFIPEPELDLVCSPRGPKLKLKSVEKIISRLLLLSPSPSVIIVCSGLVCKQRNLRVPARFPLNSFQNSFPAVHIVV